MIAICTDLELIKEFMSRDEIFKYASEKGMKKEDVTFEIDSHCFWVSFTVDGEIVGMTSFYKVSNCSFEFHPYILRSHKHLYTEMGLSIFRWFCKDVSEKYIKINAVIPDIYKETIKLAIAGGMTKEGVDRMSYKYGNSVHDRIILGITREEMSNV